IIPQQPVRFRQIDIAQWTDAVCAGRFHMLAGRKSSLDLRFVAATKEVPAARDSGLRTPTRSRCFMVGPFPWRVMASLA
ncbi:MAG: hypothetical protein L6Q83_08885, partial [Gammaproteobacteria bacterium]|nr:hypothetical protein [Gammaproteobacteria bacterium]